MAGTAPRSRLVRDTLLLYERNVRLTLRSPLWVLIALFSPLCWLGLFAPLLTKLETMPGFPPGGALRVFTPGIMMMLGMYSSAFVGFGLVPELRWGILERMRVTPVDRLALLLGRSLRDLTVLTVQALLLLGFATLLGLRADPRGAALALGLLLLLGLALSSVSYGLALRIQREDALAQLINFVTLPLVLLSGVTLPLTLAPVWLQRVATLNPLTHAVNAARACFLGDLGNAEIPRAFAILALAAALAVRWAARSFQRAAE